MISDREWDEMRTANQMRLAKLRDEIRATRRGNREEAISAIEGVADAERRGPSQDRGGTTQERDAAIAAILNENPNATG